MQLARNTHNAILTTQHTQATHINTQSAQYIHKEVYKVRALNKVRAIQSARNIYSVHNTKCAQYTSARNTQVRAIHKCAQYTSTQYILQKPKVRVQYTRNKSRAQYKNKSRAQYTKKKSCSHNTKNSTCAQLRTAHAPPGTAHAPALYPTPGAT